MRVSGYVVHLKVTKTIIFKLHKIKRMYVNVLSTLYKYFSLNTVGFPFEMNKMGSHFRRRGEKDGQG